MRLGATLRYTYDRLRLGMHSDRTMYTPVDWMHVASAGQMVCPPHLGLINRKLVHLAAERAAGRGARLMVTCPPQHGKSSLQSHYFPGWWLGMFPDDPIILASYEADFAARWGRRARDAFEAFAPPIFGVHLDPNAQAASHWGVKGHLGTMTTAGAGGAITGNPAKLFLIDDPVKGPDEARSATDRENKWEWFTSVALTRLSRGSCMAMIYTPWNDDDIGQRIIKASIAGDLEPWEILRIPAISETQDERDEWAAETGQPLGLPDPIGRKPGLALWPDMHPLSELEMRRRTNPYDFAAMYQGRPQPRGGDFFQRAWFADKYVTADAVPPDAERCRYWDRAGSKGKGDWTVGVLMARDLQGRYFVEHVVRGRWSAYERDQVIKETARVDHATRNNVRVRGEQEPGSSGKDAALAFVKMLEGYDVSCHTVTGDKESRARPFASQCQAGNVYIVRNDSWNRPYMQVLEGFPRAKNDDDVDSSSGSFNELSGGSMALRVGPSPTAGYRGRVSKSA